MKTIFIILSIFFNTLSFSEDNKVDKSKQDVVRILVLYEGNISRWYLDVINSFYQDFSEKNNVKIDLLVRSVLVDGVSETEKTIIAENLSNFFQNKIDVVVAFNFAGKFVNELNMFEGITKIIFKRGSALFENKFDSNTVFIEKKIDLAKTFVLIEKLLKNNTEKVYVISGSGIMGNYFEKISREQLSGFTNSYNIEWIVGESPNEIISYLNKNTKNNVVFFLVYHKDKNGINYFSEEVIVNIQKKSGLPIFGIASSYVNHGLTAGYVDDSEKNGMLISSVLKKILSGELKEGKIEVEEYGTLMADWKHIKEFNINENDLPDETIIVNRPETFIKRNPSLFRLILVVASILFISFLFLLYLYLIRRKLLKEISLKEKLLRITLKSIGEAVISVDMNGNIVLMNQIAEKLTGYKFTENKNKHISEILTESNDFHENTIDQQISNLITGSGDQIFSCSTKLISKNGNEFRVNLRGALISSDNNEKSGIVISFRDITDEFAKIELIRENEEKLNSIFNASPDSIIIKNLEGRIIDCNKESLRIYEFDDKNDIIGLKCEDLFPSEIKDHAKEFYYKLFEKKEIVRGEVEQLSNKGRVFPAFMSCSIVNNSDGNPEFVISIISDLSDLKTSQQKLKESEERFKLAVEGTDDGLWDIDLQNNKGFFSEQYTKMLGYTKDEIPIDSDKWLDYVHPEDRDGTIQKIDEYLLNKNGKYENIFRMKCKDGSYKWIRARGKAIWNNDGKPLRFTGFQTDITEFILVKNELEENIKRYEQAQKIGKVGNWEFYLETNLYWGSKEAKRIFGFETSENYFNQQIIKDCFVDKSKFEEVYFKQMNDETNESEYQIIPNSGTDTKFLRSLSRSIRNEKNEVVKVVGVIQDITEKVKAEEELRKSQELYKIVTDYSTDVVALYDSDYKILYLSPSVIKCNGFSEEELNKMDVFDIVHPEDLENLLFEIKNNIANRVETYINVFRIRHKEGYYYWNESRSHPIYKENGEMEYVVVNSRNIDDRKKFELALIQSEARTRRLFEIAPVGIGITKNDRIEYANPKIREMLGYEENELEGKASDILFLSKEIALYSRKIKKSLLSVNKTSTIETTFKTKKGLQVEVIMNSAYINGENETDGILSTIQNITEIKKQHNELVKAKEEAERSNKLKTEFLSQISHEIRTPVGALVSYSHLIEEDLGEKGEEFADYFAGMENSGKRIIRTIDLILNVAEIQTGSYEPLFKRIKIVADLLHPLFADFKYLAELKKLNFTLNFEEDIEVVVDEYSATQIFVNLIDNAIKYTSEGFINISVYKNSESQFTVSVKDSGIGISEEFLPNLFDPFMQEERGYTRKYEGNGLGLNLVKNYCEINGLSIKVTSKKNVGTEFFVLFPIRDI